MKTLTLAEKLRQVITPTEDHPLGGRSVFLVNSADGSLTEASSFSDEGVFMTALGMRVPSSEAEVRVFTEHSAWRNPLDATTTTVADLFKACDLETVTYEEDTVYLQSSASSPCTYEFWDGEERVELITETNGVVSFVNACDETTELKLTDLAENLEVYRVHKERVL